MIKENALVIIVVLALGCIVMTFLAILFSNALTETRRLIRMRHNSIVVNAAIVLLDRAFSKAFNSKHIIKSNRDNFQRALGDMDDRMLRMNCDDSECIAFVSKEVVTLSAIFANTYNEQTSDDKKALEKVYKCIDHNLQVLIVNLEYFQDIYDIPRIVDLIPVSKDTAASLRTHNENSLIFIENLFTYDHIACEAVEAE